MNETSTVAKLIFKLIGIAIVLGCAGTLGDKIFGIKEKTKSAILNDQMSYGQWNRNLIGQNAK